MPERPGKAKVFVSWSGELSKAVAHSLKLFLPRVIQSLDPWVSADDISAGTLWHGAIMKSLQEARFGIVVLTKENVSKPWLHYESGYMTHYIQDDRNGLVSPLLVEVPTTSIEGPMTSLQATRFTEHDLLKLVSDINALLDEPLDKDSLQYYFSNAWTTFQAEVQSAITAHSEVVEEEREVFDQEKVLTQILDTVRGLARTRYPLTTSATQDWLKKLMRERDLRPGDTISAAPDLIFDDQPRYSIVVQTKVPRTTSDSTHDEDPLEGGDQAGGDQATE